jgi:uncharacterized RDD family membrane protein YckC
VINTCKECGAINQSGAETCCFCNARLTISAEQAVVGVSANAPENGGHRSTTEASSAQPAWRREVKSRIRSYRARRSGSNGDSAQPSLQFEQEAHARTSVLDSDVAAWSSPAEAGHNHEFETEVAPETHDDPRSYQPQPDYDLDESGEHSVVHVDEQYEDPLQATLAAAARMAADKTAEPPAQKEEPFQQFLIDVSRPAELDPAGQAESPAISYPGADARPESHLYPVASLAARRHAGIVDAVVLVASYAAILGLFTAFGGRLLPFKLDAFVCASIGVLLYTQYFTLFSMMGGATPGMMFTGLRLISFDGGAPQARQLILRSVGYLISGGMAMLGFLWPYWDEDHLSWHDRISQTYVVSAIDLAKARAPQFHTANSQN